MQETTSSHLAARFAVITVLAIVPFGFALGLNESVPRSFIVLSGASLLIALMGGCFIVWGIESNLRQVEDAIEQFSAGVLDTSTPILQEPHLTALSEGLSEMAQQLRSRLESLSHLSSEQDAILRSMTEGVVTIDSEGRIRRMNEAARNLLGVSRGVAEGRQFSEVLSNSEIQNFIFNATASMLPQTGTISLADEPERVLDIYGSPLFQQDGSTSGTLIVVRDMTRVHKLENVRRDFVANVSHELRTPITSIKGFAETLLEGAMHEPEMLRKFVEIIAKHAERLHAIFNDLLILARLEAGGDTEQVEVGSHSIMHLVSEALEACSSKAAGKQISLSKDIADNINVVVNPSLVQQALVNLIDNAIKYSDSGAQVSVTAERAGDFVRCDITDTGPGIEPLHHSRLFERFYRVDHGRSRQMGGTGLGLAIVKHIAQVHGGRVEVQSEMGKGSVFSIFLRALK